MVFLNFCKHICLSHFSHWKLGLLYTLMNDHFFNININIFKEEPLLVNGTESLSKGYKDLLTITMLLCTSMFINRPTVYRDYLT